MTRQILIVDDDPAIRLMLTAHFSLQGCICSAAGNGDEALAILGRGHIQVLITDLEMPCMDGLALLRAVRTQGLITRCVVVTGHATVGNLTACLQEGAMALVPKPLDDLTVLDQAVEQAFTQMQRWVDQMNAIVRLRPSPEPDHTPGALVPRDGHAS